MGSGVKDDKIYLFIFIKIYKIYTFLLVKILWNLFYALISVFLFQQFDNQMAHAIFPTVLSPVAPPKTVAADSGECSQAAFICNALLIVRLELILWFQVCSISCTCTHTHIWKFTTSTDIYISQYSVLHMICQTLVVECRRQERSLLKTS